MILIWLFLHIFPLLNMLDSFAVSGNNSPDDNGIILINNGNSAYRIIVPRKANEIEKKAAVELQKYIEDISGVKLPVKRDSRKPREHEIIIGSSNRLDQIDLDIKPGDLEEDGFAIVTSGKKLIITGGEDKGTLYGVYTFLEKYLGCRMYSSTIHHIPESSSIAIETIRDIQVPIIHFREDYYLDVYDQDFMNWHKLDSHREEWGEWVHTFHRLVPPETYFDSHPEYFALRNGKRNISQLCLTDTNVFNIVVATLEKWMEEKPEAQYWSVSQNDNQNFCECDKCSAINNREGSPSGSVIAFVNRVAEKFPDKTISTLAYQYSRSAPENLRPAENVNIMFCSIECNRSQPIQVDPSSTSFRKDIMDWSEITNNIIVWDYVIQFQNLVSPFPNLQVLAPNIRFFVQNNTSAMFQQGNREVGGEFAELRAYLIAKLLWDPGLDSDSLINDFLNGYYGSAGPLIKEYIDRMHVSLQESGKNLEIFGSPIDHKEGYLSDSLVKIYTSLFDEVELMVAESPELFERVRIARLPLEYAILEIARAKGSDEGGVFTLADNEWIPREEMIQRLTNFVSLCNTAGITRIKEWHTTPDEYGESMNILFKSGMKKHLALMKEVIPGINPGKKYSSGNPEVLTDGMRGTIDWGYFWLGWEGEDMVVTIDLGEVVDVNKVSLGFLQDSRSWIFMPVSVSFSFSQDGNFFTDQVEIDNDLSEENAEVTIKSFETNLDKKRVQFIRVHAVNRKVCPGNHPAAGGKAWIFVDEIVVE